VPLVSSDSIEVFEPFLLASPLLGTCTMFVELYDEGNKNIITKTVCWIMKWAD